jgi:N-acetylmuramoyl-L-alanine amidase
MHHSKIIQKEEFFKSNKAAEFKMEPFAIPVPNSEERIEGLVCRPAAGHTSYYYNEVVEKDQIVLHHTAGNLQGDLGALTQHNNHVSTAFLIARDGTIYQLHPSNEWSHHLGPKALGGNVPQSKRSIGIELSNYGYLDKVGNDLETPYSADLRANGKSPDLYCTINDKDMYTKLPIAFRGKQYFATFTNEQYNQTAKLVRFLCRTYNIPIAFLPDNDRYNTTEKVVNFKGIVSHVNYRKDKWDLGPAFDWVRLMELLSVKPEKLATLESGLQAAQVKYDKAVEVFKAAQLLVWSPQGQTKKADQELEKASKVMVDAHTELTTYQNQIAAALENQTPKTRSLQRQYASEKEINKAFPYMKTRGTQVYGEDGPEDLTNY